MNAHYPPSRPDDAAAAIDARDVCFMHAALAFARSALGTTAPNPSVGALLVRDGQVIGRGVTQPGGRPHAEWVALAQAGGAARGATLYVTLEPCAARSDRQHGQSCTDAILAAGVARVVIATGDLSAFAAGGSIARLRAAGIEVVTGVLHAVAERLNLGHFRRIRDGRPLITLKLAQTRDGFAAGPHGSARVIVTGEAAARRVQGMRAAHDAIMVGAATARHDDPRLNVRLEMLPPRRPVRIVLDTDLSLSPTSRLARSAASAPVWVLSAPDALAERKAALEGMGVEILPIGRAADGRIDLRTAMSHLAARGLTRVLSEGGPTVAAALLALDAVDELALFTGPRPIGEGVPALSSGNRARLDDGLLFTSTHDWVGADRLDVFERRI